ncbi:MAG: hypothetical protein ICV70_03730 [Jiangellaceae bacterium]|nr:hypothetical protein [Jiangellaceae bacterium]
MRNRATLVAMSAVLLCGCGGSADTASPAAETTTAAGVSTPSSPPTSAPTATPTTSTPVTPTAAGTVVAAANSEFGDILFDQARQAIYLFDKEESAVAECYDECAEDWPPVLTEGAPVAGAGLDAALLGTTTRTDGTTQVTYASHPLYYYAHEGPDQVLCHNVREFGGLWLVVTPSGEPAP